MTVAVPITEETLALCTSHDQNALSAMRDNLLEDDALAAVCEPYCQDQRGTVMDFSIKFTEDGLKLNDDLTGVACIEFVEQAHYGCRDMDVQEEREIEVSFTINEEEKTVDFEVIETLPREPDEY